ncbi:MAG: NAD(+)/NADH kinase [Armatimonadetes bacterium]|nr:NAD(+)/NADH kinase [Anaerolineae bacterium]
MATLNCIGVLAHPLRPPSFPVAERIAADLRAAGVQTWVFTEWQNEDVLSAIPGSDMVVAIGGDGAMLRAARACAPFGVPVLGVNMGQLGFLTEIRTPDDWESHIARLLARDWWIEQRMMLTANVWRGDQLLHTDDALNDVVISSGAFGRMVELETDIDRRWTTTYYADALVIASPTGSTAYALACGGPILPPELKNILIVPAAPHLSMDRPIVLSEGSLVEVRPTARAEMVVTVDGRMMCHLENGDRVQIQASQYSSQFVRLRGRNYFYRALLDRLEPRVRRADHRRNDE